MARKFIKQMNSKSIYCNETDTRDYDILFEIDILLC